jgi:hypothetical protein
MHTGIRFRVSKRETEKMKKVQQPEFRFHHFTVKPVHAATFVYPSNGIELRFTADYIGKGRFCAAYRGRGKDAGNVYLVCKEDDPAKEILESCGKSRHIPAMRHIGTTGTRDIYLTEYSDSLRAAHGTAWEWFRALQRANDAARRDVRNKGIYWGYEAMMRTIELAYGNVSDDLIIDLEHIAGHAANYGETWTYEFAARNLGVDSAGVLQLRDIVFDLASVRR